MNKWIVSCDIKKYNVLEAFVDLKIINWKQTMKNIKINDEVYIYVGKPFSAVLFKTRVNKVSLNMIEIDHSKYVVDGEQYENYGRYVELELLETFTKSEYSLIKLRELGLNGNIQGPRRADQLFR